jgi:hypothetical protein
VPHRKYTYGPPRPVTGTALLFICRCRSDLTGNTSMGLHGLLGDSFHFYMQMMFVPYRKHMCVSMACYGDSFTFLCVINIRTPPKTCLWASITCYGDSFIFQYVNDIRTSQETHLCAFTAYYGDSSSFYVQMMLVFHRKHA